MRPWTLPIVGAVALSLAVPSTADAGLRFGPGALLGAVAGAMFGGFRHTGRHGRHARLKPRPTRADRRPMRWPSVLARMPPRYFGPRPARISRTTCCLQMATTGSGPTA